METSLKTGFAQIFSSCPKNLSCTKFGGAAAPLAPPARTPMLLDVTIHSLLLNKDLKCLANEDTNSEVPTVSAIKGAD